MELIDVIKKIETELDSAKTPLPFIVAIDGMSASGKTTLGKQLHEHFPDSNLFHMDDFFLQPHQRTSERLTEIGGNVDYERLQKEVLSQLRNANGLSYRRYNCQTQTLSPLQHIDWKPLVIIEGTYSHHPYFGNVYNLRIFYEISSETQHERILRRNGSDMMKRFETEWIPKENQYFNYYKIKEKSGLLL